MTLTELRYIVAVAQERHFGRASDRCWISQPGVSSAVGPYILPDLVPLLSTRAPKMPLELEENLTLNLAGMLKSGKLDVIMIALPFDEPAIMTQALYDEPFKALVPVGHP